MRRLPLPLCGLAILAGCSAPAVVPTAQPTTPPTESSRLLARAPQVNADELGRTRVFQPLTTAAEAEAVVRERLSSGRIDRLDVALKDFQWAADNLAYGELMYTPDSPAWVVTVEGEFPNPDAPFPATFKTGKFVVSPEHRLYLCMVLSPNEWVPQALPSGGVPPRVVASPSPQPSPHVSQN